MALIHRTIDACYTGVYPPGAVSFFKEYHSLDRILQRHANGSVLVADCGATIVATGSLVGNEVCGVFVDPAQQGRGIGAGLMDALEDIARRAGQLHATLSISLPSRAFYERRGYRILESRSDEICSGVHLDYWVAEKQLTADGR